MPEPKVETETGSKAVLPETLPEPAKPAELEPAKPALPPKVTKVVPEEPKLADVFNVSKKARARAILELIALWNTLWSYLAYHLRTLFPRSDSFTGGLIALMIGGLGNILSIVLGEWKANAQVAGGIRKKKDKIESLSVELASKDERIQALESRHLRDIAVGVALEAQAYQASNKDDGKPEYVVTRMKEEMHKLV